MDSHVLRLLQSRIAEIHVRWETLLRIEPVSGPLANPDAMVRLIPQALSEVFEFLAEPTGSDFTLNSTRTDRLPACECGHNPYLAFFVAAEQAFVETLVLIQAELPPNQRHEADLVQTIRVVRTIGHSEIDIFCSICAHRCRDVKCRHRAKAAS